MNWKEAIKVCEARKLRFQRVPGEGYKGANTWTLAPTTLLTVTTQDNMFCCGASEAGSWNPFNGHDSKLFDKELMLAFIRMLITFGPHQPLMLATINPGTQGGIQEALLESDWRIILPFHGNHGSSVNLLAYDKSNFPSMTSSEVDWAYSQHHIVGV